MKSIFCIVSSGTSQKLIGHLLAATERMPEYNASGVVLCGSLQEEALLAGELQRTFSHLEVTVLDSETDLHNHVQTIFPVQSQDQLEDKVRILSMLTVAHAQLLLQSLAVSVAQESTPDFQRAVSQTEVRTLRLSFDRGRPQLYPLPKGRAQWLLPRIGRTGGREPSRSFHAHTRQMRKDKRSPHRR